MRRSTSRASSSIRKIRTSCSSRRRARCTADRKQRGVYKSVDGGATWKNVLYVDDKTGAAELSMDMNNPRILYAAMWEHGRLPWKVISGGPGSGLYKSTDSGETWEKLKDGLPEEMGKMSIAVSRSNPEKVYALIESDSDKEAGGLFVSSNGGKKWSRITNDHRLVQRAWYYIELFIDPKNENTIYVLSASGAAFERRAAKHGKRCPARTAIITTSGSIPTTQTTSSSPTTAARQSLSTAARAGARRATCRRRSFIASTSTTSFRIAFMADNRTTRLFRLRAAS